MKLVKVRSDVGIWLQPSDELRPVDVCQCHGVVSRMVRTNLILFDVMFSAVLRRNRNVCM